jgi:hypothetical protein
MKQYTQFGTWLVIVLLALSALLAWSAVAMEEDVFVWLAGFMWVCLLLFYKLTITVSETHVKLKMGIGIIRKSYKIADIQSCRMVASSVWSGLGIRKIRKGWLYSVSGLQAIELHFVNKKSIVRIGADQADEICDHIRVLIGEKTPADSVPLRFASKWVMLLVALGIAALFGLLCAPNLVDTRVEMTGNSLVIKGLYGTTIPYSKLKRIDTVSFLPLIAWRINGYALGNTSIGYFRTEDGKKVKLFVKHGSSPYIVIRREKHSPIYLNFEESWRTIDLYNQLRTK